MTVGVENYGLRISAATWIFLHKSTTHVPILEAVVKPRSQIVQDQQRRPRRTLGGQQNVNLVHIWRFVPRFYLDDHSYQYLGEVPGEAVLHVEAVETLWVIRQSWGCTCSRPCRVQNNDWIARPLRREWRLVTLGWPRQSTHCQCSRRPRAPRPRTRGSRWQWGFDSWPNIHSRNTWWKKYCFTVFYYL
jgi:hypothetical protein